MKLSYSLVFLAFLLPPAAAAGGRVPRPEVRPHAPAPPVELPTVEGGSLRLAEARGDGYALLAFVRGMW